MARQFLTPIDLLQNELRNARVQNLATAPSSPVAGQLYFDTASDALRFFDGAAWVDIISSEGTITAVNVDAPLTSTGGSSPTLGIDNAVGGATPADGAMSGLDKVKLDGVEAEATANDSDANLRDRSTHTGSQAISTITGLQTELDGKADDGHTHVISDVTGLQTELDSKVDDTQLGAANGVATLDAGGRVPSSQLPPIALTEVHVVADTTERDALTVEEGDVAIVSGTSQTFIYDGTSWVEVTSPVDGVTAVTGGTGITSTGGSTPEISITNGGVDTAQIADEAVTEAKLHTDVQTKLNAATGALKYAEDIGDGTTTEFVITHNLDTRDVGVTVREAASPYAVVTTDVEMTSVNTVTVRFAVAPSAAEYRVIVVG